MSDWILWVGPDNQLVYTSPSIFETTGYTPDELMGGDSLLERLMQFPMEHTQEAVFWLRRDASFFYCSFVRDITERKRNERELVENREKLAQAMRFGKMGYFEYDFGVTQDVTELRSTEDAIRAMLHATSAIGERFFISLVKELCATLDVQFAFVSEMLSSPAPEARSIAFCMREKSLENVRFDLRGTPCEGLLTDAIVLCLSDAQRRYPDDATLPAYGAESYVGVRLEDQQGRIIGMLGVMDTRLGIPAQRTA